MKFLKTSLIAVVAVVFLSNAAWSQSTAAKPSKSYGLRAGYGTNPDQFVIGSQAVLGQTLGFMRFAPSIDIGFGSSTTTYLFNADLRMLSFSPPGSSAGLYLGGGAAIALIDVSNAGSDTEIGLNAVTGLTFPMGRKNEYNLEVRFGFADMPDLRILFGVMFGGRSKAKSQPFEIKN